MNSWNSTNCSWVKFTSAPKSRKDHSSQGIWLLPLHLQKQHCDSSNEPPAVLETELRKELVVQLLRFRPSFSSSSTVGHVLIIFYGRWFKTLMRFHYSWFIGILILAYYNPRITGYRNLPYTANNQRFADCWFSPPIPNGRFHAASKMLYMSRFNFLKLGVLPAHLVNSIFQKQGYHTSSKKRKLVWSHVNHVASNPICSTRSFLHVIFVPHFLPQNGPA